MSETDQLGLADFPQLAAPSLDASDYTEEPLTIEPPFHVIAPNLAGSDIPIAPLPNGYLAMLTEAGEMRPLDDIENEVIRFAISHYRGQMSEVARRLKIGRSTLYRKLDDASAASRD
jgi:DNA-binding NtrC family response regulator